MSDCLDLDSKAPTRISASGRAPASGLWDAPVEMAVEWSFDAPALTVTWTQPGKADGAQRGMTFHGDKGTTSVVFGDDGAPQWTPPEGWVPPAKATRSQTAYDHFFGSLRGIPLSRTTLDAERRTAFLAVAGNIAFRLGRPLAWDEASARFKDDEQANRLLANPPRGGWRL